MVDEYSMTSVEESWFSSGYKLIGGAVSTVGTFIANNTIGDAYLAWSDPEALFEELEKRSWESGTNIGIGHLGPVWQNWLPKFYWVSGSDKSSFHQIAEYGEQPSRPDITARRNFDVVKKLVGLSTVSNLHGDEAMEEKKRLKTHLAAASSSEETYQFCRDTLITLIHEQDGQVENFPVLINRLIFTILGKTVFGIKTDLDASYIPEFMKMSRLITQPWPSAKALQEANGRLRAISAELLQNSSDSIDKSKYVADHAQLDDYATEEEKIEKLSSENIAASFIASTNIADLIMKTIAMIGSREDVKEKLVSAMADWDGDLETLDSIEYLELLYLEAQRLFSPSLIARRNAARFTLVTKNEEGEIQNTSIPPNSYLFAPIRPRHLDPHLWDDPQEFIPERFAGEEGEKRRKLLVTFSDGMRSCPAKFGYTRTLFKTLITEFFSQVNELKLNKLVEEIPVFSINTSWQQEYQAEFTFNP